MTEQIVSDVARQVAHITRSEVLQVDPLRPPGSFVPNRHYRATLADRSTVFVKEATSAWTADMLRSERNAYETLRGRGFLPRYIGASDKILVVEYVSAGRWPPPWRPGDLDQVLATLGEIAATPAPGLRDLGSDGVVHCWGEVAANPDRFLGLGMCTRQWFNEVVEVLVATDATPLSGETLVHGDFRGDNAVLVRGCCVAVDWAAAARGRPDFDRSAFAVSYSVDTGDLPETVAPDADPDLVAVIAGPLARFANDPAVPDRVRAQLGHQLRVALGWWSRVAGARGL